MFRLTNPLIQTHLQLLYPNSCYVIFTSKIGFNHTRNTRDSSCHYKACDLPNFPALSAPLRPLSAQDSSPPHPIQSLCFCPQLFLQSYGALEKISLSVNTWICPLEERRPHLLAFAQCPAGRPSPLGVGHRDSHRERESRDRCGYTDQGLIAN